jgi:hypothetical protein
MELLQSAVAAEVQKLASGSDKPQTAVERDMTDQMVRGHKLHSCLPRGLCAGWRSVADGDDQPDTLLLLSTAAASACLSTQHPQQKIVERAKQMTEDDSADRVNQKAALQQEFEQLLNIFFTGVWGWGLTRAGVCCGLGWCCAEQCAVAMAGAVAVAGDRSSHEVTNVSPPPPHTTTTTTHHHHHTPTNLLHTPSTCTQTQVTAAWTRLTSSG